MGNHNRRNVRDIDFGCVKPGGQHANGPVVRPGRGVASARCRRCHGRGPCSIRLVEGREPPTTFFDELGAAFRRLRPQGSHAWNFVGAFRQLETAVRRGVRLPEPAAPRHARAEDPSGATAAPAGRGQAAREQVRRAVTRAVTGRLDEVAHRVVLDTVGPALANVDTALDATTEAFRFLAARLDALEEATARRRAPVDGMAWLVPPPALGGWADRVVEWLEPAGGTEVVVGECGDGALPRALAAAGLAVRAAEPRGAVAWEAAAGGVDVHVGPVAELLASRPTASVGGLVLAGVVDRLPVEDLLALLATAADRLAPASPMVVLGASPAAWDPVALDLLPGRPLHPATWTLLLGRHGFTEVATEATGDTYAVRGRR